MICENAYYPGGDETQKLNCKSKKKISEDDLFKERCPLIYYCPVSKRFENTEDARGCKYRKKKREDKDNDQSKSHRVRWLDEYCEYCGERINSWDKRVAKALVFQFTICERCIAEEYGMDVDYLRGRMLDRFGMRPCEGI